MKKKKNNLWTILSAMVITAFLSAVLLTFVHNITEKPIKAAQERLIAESIKKVAAGEFDNDPFAESLIIHNGRDQLVLYPARKNGYVTSVIVKSFSNKGFGGRMDVLVSFLLDGTINGYNVFNHKETPGLGSKVNDKHFKDGIIGLNPRRKSFSVKQDGGNIDAVTGATISSRAVVDAIQKAYDGYYKFNTGN